MKPRLALLLLCGGLAIACRPATDIQSSPPPPPSQPPPPPNHAPVAVVGGPYNTTTGTVQVDGSQSTDADNDALTFRWDFGDGSGGDGAKLSHTYPSNGSYNISLVVTDAKGAKDTAATTATVALEQATILVGAGNIATCGSPNSTATAQLIDALPADATVFTLGDNAFPDGTLDNYTNCYEPTWGRFLSRTYPTLGNHEYQTGDAKGSYDYFGEQVLPRNKGYYSYNLEGGAWHVIVLNDHGGSTIDAEQMSWLVADLQANAAPCTIAMWHVPLFLSSNSNWTENPDHRPIWDKLYAAGVELVLNGQQHDYERFAPMRPDGSVDSTRGIREFLVGTGGESVEQFTTLHPNSVTQAAQFGVLKLTLRHDSYDWQFIPVAGQPSYSDTGSGTCH